MGNYTPKWAMCRPKVAGFLKFLKEYRERVHGVAPGNFIENAIQAWQELSCAEAARYTEISDGTPESESSEESDFRPHKPIRSYPACNEMRCKPRAPKCPAKRKRASCKPKRKKKASCKPKRKKAACRLKRKKKKSSCRPKRKAARCGKKKKKRPSCKVKRKPKMRPGKSKEERFSFLSMFKRKSCSAKKKSSDSCSKKKSKKVDACKAGKKGGKSGKKTYKCERSGPITANGFLNFMREFRKKNCGLSPQDTLKRGARAWRKLSCAEKRMYKKMGCGVTTSERRKRSPLCRK